jgi:hypothetical protein
VTDIVVAKGLAHGLRALTLGLAVLPVLTIPFLMGGVSWTDAALSLVVNFNAMCWALAAGLLASAFSKAWLRALLGAAILAIAFFLILITAGGWLLLLTFSAKRLGQFEMNLDHMLDAGLGLCVNFGDWAGYSGRWASVSTLVWALGQTTLLSLLDVGDRGAGGGRNNPSLLAGGTSLRRQVWLRQTFCTPVLWVGFFHRWMRRKLEHNPIGWLEQRTWSGRLVTWGWFAVMISIYSMVLTDRNFSRYANHLQEVMAWLLAGSMAMSAAASFRREREPACWSCCWFRRWGRTRLSQGDCVGYGGSFSRRSSCCWSSGPTSQVSCPMAAVPG